jgi:hypothetical protein
MASSTSNIVDDYTCPACLKSFTTKKGCTSHLRSSASCSWYRKERLAELPRLAPLDLEGEGGEVEILDYTEGSFGGSDIEGDWDVLGRDSDLDQEAADLMDDFEDDDDLFHFIPLPSTPPAQLEPAVDVEEAGPGPSTITASEDTAARRLHQRQLDDDDDTRVEEEFEGAGSVTRMNETLHMRWKKIFNKGRDKDGDVRMGDAAVDDTLTWFHPFASELDWEVANWVVTESLGHKAFDRFMGIPGVCLLIFK